MSTDKYGVDEVQFLRSHRPLARRLTELESENEKLKKQIVDLTPPRGCVLIQNIDARRLCDGDTNSPGWALSSKRVLSALMGDVEPNFNHEGL